MLAAHEEFEEAGEPLDMSRFPMNDGTSPSKENEGGVGEMETERWSN